MALSLPQRVADTISRLALVEPEQTIIVALSGGADSVALLRALLCLGYKLEAVHCNFSLRGEESDEDEAFVRDLCAWLDVPLRVRYFDTKAHAREYRLSIEMAARELRYAWFRELLGAEPMVLLAVAHNADDQVETMLLNLSMGTGIRGLSGMPYKRHDRIIRPLMDCSRVEIDAYLHSIGQTHREDSTNAEDLYLRNRIRHRLIPAFREVNPAFTSGALRTIDHLRGAEHLYLYAVQMLKEQVMPTESAIDIQALKATPHPQTLLYEILHVYGFTSEQCHGIALALVDLPSGRQYLSSTHRVVRSWQILEISPLSLEQLSTIAIEPSESGEIDLPIGRLCWEVIEVKELEDLRCPTEEALFDADRLLSCQMWQVRAKREGDTLAPFGMRGRKRVKRIFVDKRLTASQRAQALLLCADESPIWLIGYLADREYGVGSSTERCVRFRLCSGN